MHQALLYEKLTDSRVRCNTCRALRVWLRAEKGVCRMYQNQDGELYNLNYAQVSSAAADPVEKKPLFHFFPGIPCSHWGAGAATSTATAVRTGKYPV
jgi:pyruvate formate lyase activating enzyme